ncbi:MAG TPA: DinB family protein [Gemmatimonadales bacterium]|nr:DinB family protein [Gemmatimonadales bacterium]
MKLVVDPPTRDEFAPYYAGYIDRVPAGAEILELLANQAAETQAKFASVAESRGVHRYAPGKWNVKELIVHLSDTERIMAYRALRIGRGDQTPLPGFDQDTYVPHSGADAQPLAALVTEFAQVRAATVALLRHLPPEAWTRRGTASDAPFSVRALAWIIAGHERHHLSTLAERYGLWITPNADRSEMR